MDGVPLRRAPRAPPDPYDLIARLARLVAGDSLVGDIRLVAVLVSLGTARVLTPSVPGLPATLGLVAVVSLAAMAWRMNPLFGLALAAPCAAGARLRRLRAPGGARPRIAARRDRRGRQPRPAVA